MSKIRILYLSNHITLSKFEIPMLQKMGYEVYMPKKPPFDISCRVDWALDKTLSIPQRDLDILNKTDFYLEPITKCQVDIINQYFAIAFPVPIIQSMKNIFNHFQGVICLRSFGTDCTYTEYLTMGLGTASWGQIKQLGTRFWFGAGYESIIESEGDFLKDKSLFMPLGFPDAAVNDRWVGGGKKILFPCPKINTLPYFKNMYNNFKRDFKGIPYAISGVQPVPVKEDPNVLGFLSNDQYVKMFTTASCMFYYSKLKTHVHYTPFEAVCWGLPLLYLKDGLIDTIGGQDLPGRCKNINEVRRKAIRLIKGDKRLAQKLRESQRVLLDVFTEEYCEKHWKKAMKILESHIPKNTHEPLNVCGHREKRICVVLPISHTDRVLYSTINLIKALVLGARECKDSVKFVFAYEKMDNTITDKYLNQLKTWDVLVRTFEWEMLNHSQFNTFIAIHGILVNSTSIDRQFVPNDGNSYFRDCDFLIFAHGNVPNPAFIPIPYAVMIHHYTQRIIPQMYSLEADNAFLNFCHGSTFTLTTAPVKEHAVQYGLLPKERVHEIPVLVDKVSISSHVSSKTAKNQKYFVWKITGNINEKHKMVLKALHNYYLRGGKLQCHIIGENVNPLHKTYKGTLDEYQLAIRHLLQSKSELKKNIAVLGYVQDQEYVNLIQNAAFILFPCYTDADYYTCFDAAYLSVPTLSSYHLGMKYLDQYFNLGINFFNSSDEDAFVKILLEAENNLEILKDSLPARDALENLTVSSSNVYLKLYSLIKFNISF